MAATLRPLLQPLSRPLPWLPVLPQAHCTRKLMQVGHIPCRFNPIVFRKLTFSMFWLCDTAFRG